MIERVKTRCVKEPYSTRTVTELMTVPSGGEWDDFRVRVIKAKVLLWGNPDANDNWPRDREYAMGIDVAAGTGASNSCISVVDMLTGEKVLEFAWHKIMEHELGHLAVALARWFKGKNGNGARMIWEARGPGHNFGQTVLSLGFRNVYWAKDEIGVARKVSDKPGWNPSIENKRLLLGDYRTSLGQGVFVNRSRQALDECLEYIQVAGDKVEHSKAAKSENITEKGTSHGDRVIADALASKLLGEVSRDDTVESPPIPVGSLAWRREQRRRAESEHAELVGW